MDEANITMHAMIFGCVWETNSIHTIFSYVTTSMSNDMRCGNILAHWFYKVSREIYGGVSPTLDDKKFSLIWFICS